jgi:putative transposase
MPYSVHFRERVIEFIEDGGRKSKALELFSLSRPIIKKCLKLKESKGSLKDNASKRPWKNLDPEVLLSYVEAHPDEKQADLQPIFGVSKTGISEAFRRLKITRKKRPHAIKSGMKISVKYFWTL